jgi:hypothetical protein
MFLRLIYRMIGHGADIDGGMSALAARSMVIPAFHCGWADRR